MGDARHTAHAAQGKSRLRKSFIERPDTVVHLPGGETMTLRRSEKDASMPLFRKLDPKKFDPKSGHHLGTKRSKAKDGGDRGKGGLKGLGGVVGGAPSMMPFSKLIVTALLAHQVFHFVNSTLGAWIRRRRRGQHQGGAGEASAAERGSGAGLAVQVWGSDEADEEDLDEEGRVKLAAARKAQAAMARAMIRNAMPKPSHTGLPHRAAQAHAARPRQAPNAKQKMGPSKDVKMRTKGKLEKMDEAVARQVKAAVAAARLQHQQQQQPQLQQQGVREGQGPVQQQQRQQQALLTAGPGAKAAPSTSRP